MTAPVLKDVAALLDAGSAPRTLVCSGLLPPELDEIAAAFAPAGLVRGRAPPRRRLGGAAARRRLAPFGAYRK